MVRIQFADSLKMGEDRNVVKVFNGDSQTAHLWGLSQPSPEFVENAENGPKRETIEWAAVVWRKMPS